VGAKLFNLKEKESKGRFPPLAMVVLVGLAVAVSIRIVYKGKPSRPSLPSRSDIPWRRIAILVVGIIAIWLLT